MSEINSILLDNHQDKPLSDELVEELMADDMLLEYDFDYSKARPNRFAARLIEVRTSSPSTVECFDKDVN